MSDYLDKASRLLRQGIVSTQTFERRNRHSQIQEIGTPTICKSVESDRSEGKTSYTPNTIFASMLS